MTPDVTQLERIENLQFAPAVPADEPAVIPADIKSDKPALPMDERLPDWRQAVDCSAWDNMCGSLKQLEGNYLPYPFPYGVKIKQEEDLTYTPLSEIPEEWKSFLDDGGWKSLNTTPPRPIQYIYPLEATPMEKEKCLEQANTLSWQDQLQALLANQIQREPQTNMVAFTISDYNYAFDMMHDVFDMNDKVVGFKGVVFL